MSFPRLAALYYLGATPFLALLDYAMGVNVRAAWLDGAPGVRAGYYLVLLGCGAIALRRPRLAASVGVVESAATIALLVIAFFTAYLGLIDDVGGDGPIRNPFTAESLANFALSAAWAYASYAAASRRLGGGG